MSKFPNLFAELVRRGYSDEDIGKIARLNLIRVLQAVERVCLGLQVACFVFLLVMCYDLLYTCRLVTSLELRALTTPSSHPNPTSHADQTFEHSFYVSHDPINEKKTKQQ